MFASIDGRAATEDLGATACTASREGRTATKRLTTGLGEVGCDSEDTYRDRVWGLLEWC